MKRSTTAATCSSRSATSAPASSPPARRLSATAAVGPIVPHSHVTNYHGNGPVTPKMKTMPYNQPQQNMNNQNMNNVEQIKKIVDLFDKKNNP